MKSIGWLKMALLSIRLPHCSRRNHSTDHGTNSQRLTDASELIDCVVNKMLMTRHAGLEDVAAMSHVLASSWKSAYRGIIDDEFLDALKDSHWIDVLTTSIQTQTIYTMVLEEDEHVIGAAVLSPEQMDIHLVSFYLLPEKIGQGFGHRFYNDIETEFKHKGFTKCILDVLHDNTRAIRFYEAHGFSDTTKRIYPQLGEYEYTCNVYEKAW